jgi:O-6-methylguanine DNA methyltransferase
MQTRRDALKGYQEAVFKTPLGWIGVTATPRGIREVIPPQKPRDRVRESLSLLRLLPSASSAAAIKVIESHLVQAQAQLSAYCEGRRRIFNLPLDIDQGSEFQRRVWQETLKVPYGETSTYLRIALQLGGRSLARAVGMALGANPLPIIIPCHRVVASDGSLGGYSGGIHVKQALLKLEGII